MTDVQEVILSIFKSIKAICEKNNLRYFAIGGTCIGAVRHNGFIPWDEDLDIAMPYEDYCKFIDISRRELPDKYKLYSPEENRHWCRNYIKIHDISTTYAEKESQMFDDRYTGVFVDVMPIYGLPKGRISQFFYQKLNTVYLNMNKIQRVYYLNDDRSSFTLSQKVIYGVLSILPLIHYPNNKDYMLYNALIRKLFERVPFDNSDKVLFGWRNELGIIFRRAFHYQTMLPYSVFSSYTTVLFEDTDIRIPVGFDSYLTKEFGDYMSIPPKSKQIRHDPVIMDLKKSYAHYIGKTNSIYQ